MTIQLPAHRVIQFFELLDSFAPSQRCTTVVKWQTLLGELRSMVLAVPGGRGLFSILQEVLQTSVIMACQYYPQDQAWHAGSSGRVSYGHGWRSLRA
jgi:hypothetical protein